nr:hypothetical protein [uncultured Roseateles sp.]
MRRCIVFFLTLFLLTQFSWATAAGYCGHEETTPKHGTHFGHHAHAHGAEETAGKPAAKSLLQATDLDHGHCHLSPVALATDDGPAFTATGRFAPPTDRPHLAESFVPEGLERPNWLRA